MKNEAIAFLSSQECRKQYFVLECGEIFDLSSEPMLVQVDELLKELDNLEPQLEAALLAVSSAPGGAFSRTISAIAKLINLDSVARRQNRMVEEVLWSLGLGAWSTILYFDFSRSEDGSSSGENIRAPGEDNIGAKPGPEAPPTKKNASGRLHPVFEIP